MTWGLALSRRGAGGTSSWCSMYSPVYNIAYFLILLTAVGVFACLAHACYVDFKATNRLKRPGKVFLYLVTFIGGVGIILWGQLYLQDTEWVQNLHQSWFGFERIGRQY